jgi:hypothetical protein
MSASDTPKAPPSVYEVLVIFLEQMASVAWQKLGLQPDMVTGMLVSSLPEARVAIDVTAHLAGVVEPQLDEPDRRRVQSLVRDLRVNYVQKSKESEN